MSWLRNSLFIAVLLAPCTGAAGTLGGGGLTTHRANLPLNSDSWTERMAMPAPGPMQCFGARSFAWRQGARLGGRIDACSAPRASQVFTGLEAGWQTRPTSLYGGLHAGLGVGQVEVGNPDGRWMTSRFVYARPTVTVGLPLKWIAVELSAFAMLPWGVQANLDGRILPPTGGDLRHAGLELAVLLGNFHGRPDPTDGVLDEAPRDEAPRDEAPRDDERPLAIPGDAPR